MSCTVTPLVFFALLGASEAPSSKLISALIAQESRGNDYAVGDKHLPKGQWAHGCLQIRQPCLDDVNERFGRNIKLKDLLGDRELSIWVCKKYLSIYATKKEIGRNPTDEDRARIWNGGPTGWKKASTKRYWSEVKGRLK